MIKEEKTAVKHQSNIGSALKDKRKLLRYYFKNMDVEETGPLDRNWTTK